MAGVPDAKRELEAAALAASEKPAENAESEEEIDTLKEEGTAEEEKDPNPESPKLLWKKHNSPKRRAKELR